MGRGCGYAGPDKEGYSLTLTLSTRERYTLSKMGRQTTPTYTPPVVPGAPGQADIRDAQDNKVMAILAYFGPVVLVPILAARESRFARYHANQGLVLLIACIVFLVLAIIGIINASKGEMKLLPVISGISILK